jgi:hypothetical protein
MSIRLKQITIDHIRNTSSLRLKIQAQINISHNTMIKCLEENDPRLTISDVLNVITEDMQRPLSELIDGRFSRLMLK